MRGFVAVCFLFVWWSSADNAQATTTIVMTTVSGVPSTYEEIVDMCVGWVVNDGGRMTLDQWMAQIRNFDSNGDGEITVQEFGDNDLYAPILGPHGGQSIFNFHDRVNGQADGQVLLTDFRYSFNLLDKNGDGFITPEEMRERIKIILDTEAREETLLDELLG